MAKREDSEAIDIYQKLMDEVDQAFMTRDAARHAEAIYVPHHIRTRKEIIHIRNVEELYAAFHRYLDFTDSYGAVKHHRKVLTARFRNKDSIEGAHMVNTLDADGKHITPPTRTTVIIMRIQGAWRVCGSDSTTEKYTGVEETLSDFTKQNQGHLQTSKRPLRNMTGETS